MGTISLSLPGDGTTADVSDVNTPFTTIANVINGNLDNTNIATGAAIATSKIAQDGGLSVASVGTGFAIQQVSSMFSAVATGTTLIPFDDTIPQITEGTEFMTLAITPKSATNVLVIRATVFLASSSTNNNLIAALFQDSTANALAVQGRRGSTTTDVNDSIVLEYTMAAGTTSSTTFRIRAGGNGSATFTFNGTAGNRVFGTAAKSSMVIIEYKV